MVERCKIGKKLEAGSGKLEARESGTAVNHCSTAPLGVRGQKAGRCEQRARIIDSATEPL